MNIYLALAGNNIKANIEAPKPLKSGDKIKVTVLLPAQFYVAEEIIKSIYKTDYIKTGDNIFELPVRG